MLLVADKCDICDELTFSPTDNAKWCCFCGAKLTGTSEPIFDQKYSCEGKGGEYQKLGSATGAGTSKYKGDRVVYQDLATGRLFFRTEQDFSERMAKV